MRKSKTAALPATPPFEHVPEITERHAEMFATEFFLLVKETGDLGDSITASQIMKFPGWPDDWTGAGNTAEQRAFMETQVRMGEAIMAEIREALKAAFRRAATEHLNLNAASEAVRHA